MKKLMTMIAAVATAFGLYAADPVVTGSASFESGEEGVGTGVFTPGTGWTWTGDPLTLGAYLDTTSDYPTDAYQYNDATGDKRRTDVDSFATQVNYLKLETGNDKTLSRAIAGSSVFVDQVVQFTGFEDAPAFGDDDDTKIAVWMEEAVISDEPEVTATNLWITAGAEKVQVQIGATNEYQLGKWYRLTIKAIPNILKDPQDGNQAGFVVYINGNQVKAVAAKDLAVKSDLIDDVASLYDEGSLFPAMETGAIASVGYKGIGAIDDLVIDDQGPEFARKVTFTLNPVPGATITDVEGADDLGGGNYQAAPGAPISVVLLANSGKLFKNSGSNVGSGSAVAAAGALTITLDKEDEIIDAGVSVTLGAETYDSVDLEAAFNDWVDDGCTITLLKDQVADGLQVDAQEMTIELNGKTLSISEGATLTLNEEVTLQNSVAGQGGLLNEGTININADLDLSEFAWAAGGLLPTDKTGVKLVIDEGVTVKFAAGNNPNAMEASMVGFLSGSANGALFENGAVQYTYVAADTKWYIDTAATATIAFAGGVTEAEWTKGGALPEVTVTTDATYEGAWDKTYPENEPDADVEFTYTVTFTGEYKGEDVTKTFKVKKPAAQTYNITITPPANGTLETSVTNGVAEGTVVTVTATPAVGFELESITLDGTTDITDAKSFQMPAANATVAATFKKTQQGWDVPSGKENEPASEVWDTIPSNLADVPAGRISTWAKTYSVPFGGSFTDVMEDAYLLDCDPNDSTKIAEEKAKINIASIEFKNGEWVVTTVSDNVATDEFGNGKLVLEDVTESITGAAGSAAAKLWKMKLVPITAAE